MVQIVTAFLACLIIRNCYLLRAIFRSWGFLSSATDTSRLRSETSRKFLVLIPMLRETSNIESAVDHFNAFTQLADVQVVVITTERERVGIAVTSNTDTITMAARLASAGRCLHIHYPHQYGLKGDQLNYALAHLAGQIRDTQLQHTFGLIYDADSRPRTDTLEAFNTAIDHHPDANIFHQSSIFQVRHRPRSMSNFSTLLAGAGALRANRFVLAHELRKLLNRIRDCSHARHTYTHVTGHGLCARLSFLLHHPFPARTPIEDMEFSFELCVRGEPMIPVKSLDNAEVPLDPKEEFRQLSRWFAGPGRFLSYFRRYGHQSPLGAFQLSASAALISLEWLSCAFIAPFIIWAWLACDSVAVKFLVATYCGIVLMQLFTVRFFLNKMEVGTSFAHIAFYPISCMLFGLAGIFGALRIAADAIDNGKTER
ncbi:glycosyltransferase [Burkholderia sp. Se-20373]|uniref:glycosyltransferase n=1 Tax=Burkholderia sp. Se-20373 TaxID=2703898 RepID=UPI00197CEEEC|nr:glycosyltransferase family 2 protein [Burkholderia sp. Se-20373]MBN3743928.1 glycosyltransferase [Burkholderia sp. Se-20373]